MKLNWNFQRGVEVLGKIASVGEVWIIFGTTQYQNYAHATVLLRNIYVSHKIVSIQ